MLCQDHVGVPLILQKYFWKCVYWMLNNINFLDIILPYTCTQLCYKNEAKGRVIVVCSFALCSKMTCLLTTPPPPRQIAFLPDSIIQWVWPEKQVIKLPQVEKKKLKCNYFRTLVLYHKILQAAYYYVCIVHNY